MKKKIIISFDYELFFGDNPGTVQGSLVGPTNQILEALRYANGKATFFVDYLMLKYMLRNNDTTKAEAALIIEQLKEIVRQGSRIELHLHPHWVDAKYHDGKWDFSDFSHYCLSSFPKEEITQMFVEGTDFLEKIAREVDPSYKIVAYRAGGWAVLPFSKMKEGFFKAGIKVDSSVMQGAIIESNGIKLDFTNSPIMAVYRFNEDVLKEEENGSFIESQICSFRSNIFSYIYGSIWHHLHPNANVIMTDGSHYRASLNQSASNHHKVKKSRWEQMHRQQAFGLTGLPPFLLRYHIRHCRQPYVVIISHPKDLTQLLLENIRGLKGRVLFESYQTMTTL